MEAFLQPACSYGATSKANQWSSRAQTPLRRLLHLGPPAGSSPCRWCGVRGQWVRVMPCSGLPGSQQLDVSWCRPLDRHVYVVSAPFPLLSQMI